MTNLLDNPKSVPVASVSENFTDGFDSFCWVWESREPLILGDQKHRKRSTLPKCSRRKSVRSLFKVERCQIQCFKKFRHRKHRICVLQIPEQARLWTESLNWSQSGRLMQNLTFPPEGYAVSRNRPPGNNFTSPTWPFKGIISQIHILVLFSQPHQHPSSLTVDLGHWFHLLISLFNMSLVDTQTSTQKVLDSVSWRTFWSAASRL